MGQTQSSHPNECGLRLPKTLRRKKTVRKSPHSAPFLHVFPPPMGALSDAIPSTPPFSKTRWTQDYTSSETSTILSSLTSSTEPSLDVRRSRNHPYARKEKRESKDRRSRRSVYSSKWEPPRMQPTASKAISTATYKDSTTSSCPTTISDVLAPTTPKVCIGFPLSDPGTPIKIERDSLAPDAAPLENPYSLPKISLLSEQLKSSASTTSSPGQAIQIEWQKDFEVPRETEPVLLASQPSRFSLDTASMSLLATPIIGDFGKELEEHRTPVIEPSSLAVTVIEEEQEEEESPESKIDKDFPPVSPGHHARVSSISPRKPLPPTPSHRRAVSTPVCTKDAFSAYQEWSTTGTGPLCSVLHSSASSSTIATKERSASSTTVSEVVTPPAEPVVDKHVVVYEEKAQSTAFDFSFSDMFQSLELKEFPLEIKASPDLIESRPLSTMLGADPKFSVQSKVIVRLPNTPSLPPLQASRPAEDEEPFTPLVSYFQDTFLGEDYEAPKLERKRKKDRSSEIDRRSKSRQEEKMGSRTASAQAVKRGYSSTEISDWLAKSSSGGI